MQIGPQVQILFSPPNGVVSSAGRALHCGCRGRWVGTNTTPSACPVSLMVRTADFRSADPGSIPGRGTWMIVER